MIKEYSQNRSNVIVNFSLAYCKTPLELLQSNGFNEVLKKYLFLLRKRDALLLEKLQVISKEKELSVLMIEAFELLVDKDINDIIKEDSNYYFLVESKEIIIEFIEGLYNYWRTLERYSLILSTQKLKGVQSDDMIEANTNFSILVLKVYRSIEEDLLGYHHNVYRQLNAGINAGLILNEYSNNLPNEYQILKDIHFIKTVVITAPFIMYPKRNTRSGIFKEVFYNPLDNLIINKSHLFCFPAKVGESLAFIYFHRDFMNHGVALANLFELAKYDEYKNTKPDLILLFGVRSSKVGQETVFYSDKENDIFVGLVNNSEENDYFGYMKKMLLTIHNVRMIDKGYLPVHGAMVNIVMKNNKSSNVVIIGDSGTGKSESLEAFRLLSKEHLKEMKIIFDDMGTFKIINNEVYGYGTETGAFVRLDDLDGGYAFNELDRAIFMNPQKVNSRLMFPVSTYESIVKGHKVDILLYANNYEDSSEVLKMFNNIDEAKKVFVKGTRRAKGTTSETGLVNSYFANPFGPVQRIATNNIIIDKVFETLFNNQIEVGEIYTKLGIKGCEQLGPKKAAKKLFELIKIK